MKLVDEYFNIQEKIYDYFGYHEQGRAIPMEDRRQYYWYMDNDKQVHYAKSAEELQKQDGKYYVDKLYRPRIGNLENILVGEGYTMIAVDTQTNGNVFLAIFDNDKKGIVVVK